MTIKESMAESQRLFDEFWGESPEGSLKYKKGQAIRKFIVEREQSLVESINEGYRQALEDFQFSVKENL